jgi:hypothetical protein
MATDIMAWWKLHLPPHLRETAPERPEGTDLAIWREEIDGNPFAYGFQGKARQPVWAYRFKDAAHRERFIGEKIAARRAHFGRKAERAAERKQATHSLTVGDILSSSWGYDQTNVDFYEVVAVPSSKSVIIRKIASQAAARDRVAPQPGVFIEGPMLKRVTAHGSVKIEDYAWASKWSGAPMYQTDIHEGH